MKLRVTHYVRRSPERDQWIPLTFVTKDVSRPDGPYFLGFETFRPLTEEEVRTREEANTIKRLKWPCAINENQALWLSPETDVWLASAEDPRGDRRKLLVERGTIRAISTIAWDSAGVTNRLQQSDVGRYILQSGHVKWFRGDYLNSKRQPGEVYQPTWQESVKTIMLSRLREISKSLQSGGRQILEEHIQEDEHYYPYIERQIALQKVALPLEMIFETNVRSSVINVVQLANVHNLSLVYVKGESIEQDLQLKGEEVFAKTSEEWLQRMLSTQARLCVHALTAADHFLSDAIGSRQLGRGQLDRETSLKGLLRWINDKDNSRTGLIACDVGIALQLVNGDSKLEMVFVPYDEPIPVGIAYNKSDPTWGRFLDEVVEEVLSSNDERVMQSIEDTKERCDELSMVWVRQAA